jgi:hypothetical protein
VVLALAGRSLGEEGVWEIQFTISVYLVFSSKLVLDGVARGQSGDTIRVYSDGLHVSVNYLCLLRWSMERDGIVTNDNNYSTSVLY